MGKKRLSLEIMVLLLVLLIFLVLYQLFSEPKTIEQKAAKCWEMYGEDWQECLENWED